MKSIFRISLLFVFAIVALTTDSATRQFVDGQPSICVQHIEDIPAIPAIGFDSVQPSFQRFVIAAPLPLFGDTGQLPGVDAEAGVTIKSWVQDLTHIFRGDGSIQKAGGGFALVSSWLLMWWGSIALRIKKTPSSNAKDTFVQYALDGDGAGTAAPHFRTEDGKTIKLYPADALTAAEAGAVNTGDAGSDTVITNMRTRLGEVEALLVANGLLTEA